MGEEALLEPAALNRLNTDRPINRVTDQVGDFTGDLTVTRTVMLTRPRSALGAHRRCSRSPRSYGSRDSVGLARRGRMLVSKPKPSIRCAG